MSNPTVGNLGKSLEGLDCGSALRKDFNNFGFVGCVSEALSCVGAVEDLGDRGKGFEVHRVLGLRHNKKDNEMHGGTVERAKVDTRLGTGENGNDFFKIGKEGVGNSDTTAYAGAALVFARTKGLEG
jgi:hypothetical protein